MVKDKILNTIIKNNLIEKNEHIVIGLSGGPDSVCLFHNLRELSEELSLTIHAVHVNHKFRPGAAEEDQRFVEELCEDCSIKCYSFQVDCNEIAKREKITSEEAGRKVRYESFAQVCQKLVDEGISRSSIKVAIAQNQDDQSETILFRVLRGVGTDGLAGIDYVRSDQWGNKIIRPLLDVNRNEIMDYLDSAKLNYRVDHTNMEAIYTRNKIRLNLIPYLEREFNENIKETLVRMGNIARTDSDFLWQESQKTYEKALLEEKLGENKTVTLDRSVLKATHKSIFTRVIHKALETVGLGEDISYAHLGACEKVVNSENASATVVLPKDYRLIKSYEKIIVMKADDNTNNNEALTVSAIKKSELKERTEGMLLYGAFDLDEIRREYGEKAEDLVQVRERISNDYISISEKCRKKIQNLLVDDKIPRHLRDGLKIVAIGNDCLWIRYPEGKGRFTSKFKVEEQTKNILLVEINIRV